MKLLFMYGGYSLMIISFLMVMYYILIGERLSTKVDDWLENHLETIVHCGMFGLISALISLFLV